MDVRRRALEETAADAAAERRHATTSLQRFVVECRSLMARIRVRLSTASLPDLPGVNGLGRDSRVAWRRLRRTPVFTAFAVLTLAIGIGATAAIYSVIRVVLGPPSGVGPIDRVVNIYHWDRGGPSVRGMSWPDYLDFRQQQTSFERVIAWSFFGAALAANDDASTEFAERVSGDYFHVLGVTPLAGRPLQEHDDRAGAPRVAVISHRTAMRYFGAPDRAVGASLKINGEVYQIVGVAPPAFRGLFNNGLVPSAAWLPLSSFTGGPGIRGSLDLLDRDDRWLMVKGVLKDGVSLEQAAGEVAAIGARLDADYPLGRGLAAARGFEPVPYERSRPWSLKPMRDVRINESDAALVEGLAAGVMAAVLLVLLVACTNLANLMLARGSSRRHDMAVRLALGGTRRRLVRETLVESLLVAGAAAVAGIVVAKLVVAWLTTEIAVAGTLAVIVLTPQVDGPVLLMVAAAALIALLTAGLIPAVHTTRSDVRSALAADTGGAAPRWRGRRILIALQVTVSVVLVAGAVLAAAQVRTAAKTDYGFALDHLAVARVDLASQRYDPAVARPVAHEVLQQLSLHPDVEAAAIVSDLPLGSGSSLGAVVERPESASSGRRPVIEGSSSLFAALGLSFVRGQPWTDGPPGSRPAVVVIDASGARELFGTDDAVGRVISVREQRANAATEQLTVVGVVEDTDRESNRSVRRLYRPIGNDAWRSVALVARAGGDPRPLVTVLRETFRRVAPELAIRAIDIGPEVNGSPRLFFAVSATLMSLLGGFAWLLALAGLYGLLSHVVLRRTREIGVRVALGAPRRAIAGQVVVDGLRPVLAGVVLGLLLGALGRQSVGRVFFRLLPDVDVLALALVPVLFLGVAAIACYLPARRAARVDPVVALREF